MSAPIWVGLTSGCPAGVGPELLARAVAELPPATTTTAHFRFFGSAALLERAAGFAGVAATRAAAASETGAATTVQLGAHRVVCTRPDGDDDGSAVRPGQPDDVAIAVQQQSLRDAIAAAQRGTINAILTAPVRKRALDLDGVSWPGQTELVHHHLAVDDDEPLMVFAGGPFILGLATVHLPLRDVADALTPQRLTLSLRRLRDATAALTGNSAPRLAVLGLNPHAGEGGRLGVEEQTVMAPVLAAARADDVHVVGPLPADGFFADVARVLKQGTAMPVDGVLATAHDQGLAPYKLLSAGDGVNITWGLRVPRTSPDHGTADALAGTGRADAASMRAALGYALTLADGLARTV